MNHAHVRSSLDNLQPAYARVRRNLWFTQWYERNCLNLEWLLRMQDAAGSERLQVLELGIGWGGASLCLAQRGALVIGVDDFQDGFDEQGAPQMEFLSRHHVKVVRADVLCLPLRPGSFDVVILNDVLEHLTIPKRLLHAIHDLLRPGGVFMMEVPNSVALYKRLRVLCGRSNYFRMEHFFGDSEYRGHIREYTKAEVAYMLRQTGFAPVEIRGVNQAYRPWFESRTSRFSARVILTLYARLTRMRDCWKDHFCCIAQKLPARVQR
jgi:2-polyprenyl-3-methyl-5-hydroxy-6-metoxy-1,4-benzoquinol methylase